MLISLTGQSIVERARDLFSELDLLPDPEKIEVLNQLRGQLHKQSPFKDEPIDCVLWKQCSEIEANDYNPNVVAPPEMKLLKHSIAEDGYTQPIVTWFTEDNKFEVIDGFHRNRVGREVPEVKKRLKGYLPITVINQDRTDRKDRIASTIRHNRARGKHQVAAMSEIVQELAKKNWTDERIAKELGMDADEVLRLKQISGLAELFADKEFSQAWDIDFNGDLVDG